MKLSDLLAATLNEDRGFDSLYKVNPTKNQILGMCRRSHYGDIRGLFVGGNLYVWDEDITHQQFFIRVIVRGGIAKPDDWTQAYRFYFEQYDGDLTHTFGEFELFGQLKVLVWSNGHEDVIPVEEVPGVAQVFAKRARVTEARYTRPNPEWFGVAKILSQYQNEVIDWIADSVGYQGVGYNAAEAIRNRIEEHLGVRWADSEQARADLEQVDLSKFIRGSEIMSFVSDFGQGDWEGISNAMIEPKRRETGWVIHFSDHAEDIAEHGFIHGADSENLGITRRNSVWSARSSQVDTPPGWNFGIPLKTQHDLSVADYMADHGGYGKHAVVFRTRFTRIIHHGDNHEQALFWGPDVPPGSMIVLTQYGDGLWESPEGVPEPFLQALRSVIGG